ncbi:hypothetical protein Ahy_A01g001982 isoform D [Arachis hypogaea]|uniref:Uncharacterized protein n=1 Tax=Arachis hypogaea TaxID=3818 RepID=A0A445EPU4_ARAHY|nr:hypothetical protein Ahy_A01g001982 isoform D [Arachis hypogaea]
MFLMLPIVLVCLFIPLIIIYQLKKHPRYSFERIVEKKMRGQIMLFGDSITEQSFRQGGWGAALANAYCRQADVVLRGYAGYNTKWALFLLNRIFPLDSSKPRIATTIFFGANDAALSGRTNERSLLGENAPKLSERTNEVTGQYARACIETAKEMGVMSVDLWSKMQETDDWQNKFLIDGLHLTTEGNAIVYQEVIKSHL